MCVYIILTCVFSSFYAIKARNRTAARRAGRSCTTTRACANSPETRFGASSSTSAFGAKAHRTLARISPENRSRAAQSHTFHCYCKLNPFCRFGATARRSHRLRRVGPRARRARDAWMSPPSTARSTMSPRPSKPSPRCVSRRLSNQLEPTNFVETTRGD